MPTFQFDDRATTALPIFVGPGTDLVVSTFTEDGVQFTLSASTTEDEGVGFSIQPNQDGGQLQLTNTSAGATWILDVQSPGGTTPFGGNFDGSVTIAANFNTGIWNVTFQGSTPGQNVVRTGLTGVQNVTAPSGSYTQIVFTETSGMGSLEINTLTTGAITCYCEGTRIATPCGFKLVENLSAGDKVLTADGRTVDVQWLGRQSVNPPLSLPTKVNPVCISAGALGDGLPERDLWVSPDHAIALDGYLVNASALRNGSTIYTVPSMPLTGFTYFHVECDNHELLLAEGVAAESYLDNPSRDVFDNAAERADAPSIKEMELPRVSAARMLPKEIVDRIAKAQPGKAA